MSERRGLLGLDWVTVIGSALAAVSSAVILSTLGAGGTLIGAAVGSIVATVSSAMYTRGLQTSKEKVAVVFQSGGIREVSRDEADRLEASGELADREVSDAVLGARGDEQAQAEGRRTVAERLRAVNWRKVVPWTVATFVVVMAAITAFELIGGKPVSSLTGGSDGTGTSISRVVDRGNDRGDDRRNPSEKPSESGTTSEQPSEDPTDPSQAPSETPTDVPSETPSAEPSETPSGFGDPSESPSDESTSQAPAPSQQPMETPAATR